MTQSKLNCYFESFPSPTRVVSLASCHELFFRELAADFLNFDPDTEEVTMSAETNLEVSRKVQGYLRVKV